MPGKYTKTEVLAEEVFHRKAAGETNRKIKESFRLTEEPIKEYVKRQNRKKRVISNDYVPLPKGLRGENGRNKTQ